MHRHCARFCAFGITSTHSKCAVIQRFFFFFFFCVVCLRIANRCYPRSFGIFTKIMDLRLQRLSSGYSKWNLPNKPKSGKKQQQKNEPVKQRTAYAHTSHFTCPEFTLFDLRVVRLYARCSGHIHTSNSTRKSQIFVLVPDAENVFWTRCILKSSPPTAFVR